MQKKEHLLSALAAGPVLQSLSMIFAKIYGDMHTLSPIGNGAWSGAGRDERTENAKMLPVVQQRSVWGAGESQRK